MGAAAGAENRLSAWSEPVATSPTPYSTTWGRNTSRSTVPSVIWASRTTGSSMPAERRRMTKGDATMATTVTAASPASTMPRTPPARRSVSSRPPVS